MKFTKEQAVESITAKFADKAKGIDLARTIDEVVSNNMSMLGENSEMELDAFVASAEKNVSTALGLARHLKTTTQSELQQQLDELKAKLEGKEPPKPNPKPTEIKSDDPAIQAMLEKLTKMEEKLQTTEREKSVSEKRSAIKTKMAESIKDNDWIDAYLAEINVTEETDVEAKAKDYVAFYNKTHAKGGKLTPKPAGGSDDGENSYVRSTVAAAAQIKKTMGGGPVKSTTVNNNNNN